MNRPAAEKTARPLEGEPESPRRAARRAPGATSKPGLIPTSEQNGRGQQGDDQDELERDQAVLDGPESRAGRLRIEADRSEDAGPEAARPTDEGVDMAAVAGVEILDPEG